MMPKSWPNNGFEALFSEGKTGVHVRSSSVSLSKPQASPERHNLPSRHDEAVKHANRGVERKRSVVVANWTQQASEESHDDAGVVPI